MNATAPVPPVSGESAVPSGNSSIKRQILTLALLFCVGIMIPVGVGLFLHYTTTTQKRLEESVAATARMIAANTSAALAFSDQPAAGEILQSLRHDPLIRGACIYLPNGDKFVHYPNDSVTLPSTTVEQITVPIEHDGVVYGRLVLGTDMAGALRQTTRTWIGVYTLAFIVAGVAAWFIARRFQRTIALPLIKLARTAESVTNTGEYASLALPVPEGSYEVARLTQAFNTMLREISTRDAALAAKVERLNEEIQVREIAENSLRQNQAAMQRLSREAGMAEVSTGVLHNIGNALTSINVSSELLAIRLDSICKRPLAGLRNTFESPPPSACAVFSAHPDGKELQTFTASLALVLARELEESREIVTILRTGVGHLKNIVASQQSLARTSRIEQEFSLNEAIKEAVVLARSITRYFPPLRRNVYSRDIVYADHSLAVQILLNLLVNARDAIQEQAPSEPLIEIKLYGAEDGLVALSITDNGVGIAPERIVSIFNYGNSTKPKGHGFGLHNAANAARAQGGRLTASSPGVGHGATFTLYLPASSSAAAPI